MISPAEPSQTRLQASQLEIRRMRAHDVPQVMEIESVSFGRHHWSDDSFFNEMNNQVGRYYSLIHAEPGAGSGKVIGYLGFWFLVDECHVTTVAVHPACRGNALGELLLLHCMERCQAGSIHWISLEVRAGNYNAQNLYYKYGFASVGVRPRYYQDNQEDALIMTTPDIASEEYRKLLARLKGSLEKRLNGFPAGLGVS